MTRDNARADLKEWFVAVDRVLAEGREHAISPSRSRRPDPATWTMTVRELRDGLIALVERLVNRPGRWILLLNPEGTQRYLQLLAFEDGSLWVEAVSNKFLGAGDELKLEDEEALAATGWNPPSEPDQPNWWSTEDTIFPDVARVGTLLGQTLEAVYRLPHARLVSCRVFSSSRRGSTPASP